MKYVLELTYNGTNYHGWQTQKNAHAVQDELNSAISTLLRLPTETIGSGRTDTGVHALQQFVQFETEEEIIPTKFIFQLNSILPYDIYVKHIYKAESAFNVRFEATQRSYEYRISFTKNPFLKNQCCFYFKPPHDIRLMNVACSILLKYTDFQSFSKYKTDVNHYNCTITKANWVVENDMLLFRISADRFLRGMVRAIVGTMLELGQSKISIDDFEQIILKRDRIFAKAAAPPQGLFLTEIIYPQGSLQLLA